MVKITSQQAVGSFLPITLQLAAALQQENPEVKFAAQQAAWKIKASRGTVRWWFDALDKVYYAEWKDTHG